MVTTQWSLLFNIYLYVYTRQYDNDNNCQWIYAGYISYRVYGSGNLSHRLKQSGTQMMTSSRMMTLSMMSPLQMMTPLMMSPSPMVSPSQMMSPSQMLFSFKTVYPSKMKSVVEITPTYYISNLLNCDCTNKSGQYRSKFLIRIEIIMKGFRNTDCLKKYICEENDTIMYKLYKLHHIICTF